MKLLEPALIRYHGAGVMHVNVNVLIKQEWFKRQLKALGKLAHGHGDGIEGGGKG